MPFQLSEELVDKLLDKLSSDEDFRTSFQKSPRQALASLGHTAAAKASDSDKGAWACMSCKQLASAADIKKSRDALRTQLLSAKVQFNPIALEAAK